MYLLEITLLVLHCVMQNEVITFKASKHFREHLEKQAVRKKLKPGTYIKAVLKKYTKYKEPEIL